MCKQAWLLLCVCTVGMEMLWVCLAALKTWLYGSFPFLALSYLQSCEHNGWGAKSKIMQLVCFRFRLQCSWGYYITTCFTSSVRHLGFVEAVQQQRLACVPSDFFVWVNYLLMRLTSSPLNWLFLTWGRGDLTISRGWSQGTAVILTVVATLTAIFLQ